MRGLFCSIAICLAGAGSPAQAGAQTVSARPPQATTAVTVASPVPATAGAVVPLSALLQEAARNNPDILAAARMWQATTRVAPQVSSLPDPQVVFQQLDVGSPRPFAGFTNSDFAYVGLGVSQDVPFPGTLALRGQAAERASDASRRQVDAVRRQVQADIRDAYARLGRVQESLAILTRDAPLLAEIEQIAEARYRVGRGSEQAVLEAQLQQTRLQRDVALRQQDRDLIEARLKQLVGRAQESPDIVAAAPVETPLPPDPERLLQRVETGNPSVLGRRDLVREAEANVALAHKAFDPDFTVQFMWQHTAEPFRDMYMFTVGARIPLYWRHRQVPGLAEATDRLAGVREEYTADIQAAQAQLRDQLSRAETAGRLLTIDRDGLIPQARAAFQAGLAAYQSGRLDFNAVLRSFLDVLALEDSYWQTLADHEAAVARIEQLTGVPLP